MIKKPFGLKIIAFVDSLLGLFCFGFILLSAFKEKGSLCVLQSGCGIPLLMLVLSLFVATSLIYAGYSIYKMKISAKRDNIYISILGALISSLVLLVKLTVNSEMFLDLVSIGELFINGFLVCYFIWTIFYLNGAVAKRYLIN